MNITLKEAEANAVLINGIFQAPNANQWCQPAMSGWWQYYTQTSSNKFYNSGDAVIGPNSLTINPMLTTTTAVLALDVYQLDNYDLNLIQNPTLTFWIKSAQLQTIEVRAYTDLYDVGVFWGTGTGSPTGSGAQGGAGNYFFINDLTPYTQSSGSGFLGTSHLSVGWVKIEIPLAPSGQYGGWNIVNHATWSKPLKRIAFRIVGGAVNNGYVYIDGININGQTLRGASSFSTVDANGAKMKFVNESLYPGYTLSVSAAPDTLDNLCIAESLRCTTTPFNGTVQFPLDITALLNNQLMPGQMLWIKHPQFNNTTKQFRFQWLQMNVNEQGAIVNGNVTDDLTNAYARDPSDSQNERIKEVNPDYNNRDYARLKTTGLLYGTPLIKYFNTDSYV